MNNFNLSKSIMEAVYVDAVKSINKSVDDMMNFLIRSPAFPNAVTDDAEAAQAKFDQALFEQLGDKQLSAEDAKDFVVRDFVQGSFFRILHDSFFKGRFFYGVGSESFGNFLDAIMDKVEAEEGMAH